MLESNFTLVIYKDFQRSFENYKDHQRFTKLKKIVLITYSGMPKFELVWFLDMCDFSPVFRCPDFRQLSDYQTLRVQLDGLEHREHPVCPSLNFKRQFLSEI